jgi:hypothetical protein
MGLAGFGRVYSALAGFGRVYSARCPGGGSLASIFLVYFEYCRQKRGIDLGRVLLRGPCLPWEGRRASLSKCRGVTKV